MKIRNLYSVLLFLLLALNAIGGSAYSFTTVTQDPDPRHNDYLQEEQNSSALYLEETSAHAVGQVNSKNDLFSGNYLFPGKGFFYRRCLSNSKLTINIIQDKKEILTASIFPYHFFW